MSIGFIVINGGIIAVRASPSTLNAVLRQTADEIAAALVGTSEAAISAWEIASLANDAREAVQDRHPELGAIRVVGAVAVGTVAGMAAIGGIGVVGAAVIGWVAGEAYGFLWDRARALGEDCWTNSDPSIDPILSPEEIPTEVNTSWGTARTPVRRDPLAIDLDGDGIETIGIPTSGTPILFDHDADGIKTGTGWVKADDAWLVLDRDGNGTIDSGRELFGVDTLITVTETLPGDTTASTYTRNARTGFEALRTLDTGNGSVGSLGYGDGIFDANDAAFSQVRLWQDLNQDGISQAGELSTLAAKGIASIGLTPSTTTVNLGNGNTITGQATVTRSNGSTTQIDSVDLQAGNLDLADNPFYREFTNFRAARPSPIPRRLVIRS